MCVVIGVMGFGMGSAGCLGDVKLYEWSCAREIERFVGVGRCGGM